MSLAGVGDLRRLVGVRCWVVGPALFGDFVGVDEDVPGSKGASRGRRTSACRRRWAGDQIEPLHAWRALSSSWRSAWPPATDAVWPVLD